MTFHTPPENQGQMVEVSYASDGEYAYRRVYDCSDRSESIERVAWGDWWADVPEGTNIDWEPWNKAPTWPGHLAVRS